MCHSLFLSRDLDRLLEFVLIEVGVEVCPGILRIIKQNLLQAVNALLPLIEPLLKAVLSY